MQTTGIVTDIGIDYETRKPKISLLLDTKDLSIVEYAREVGLPETTLRDWIKTDRELGFGKINIKATSFERTKAIVKKPIVFVNENIRIELKEGFNKQFLRKIIEVLIDDN